MTANPFQKYLAAIEKDLRRGIATEHTHRPALKALIEEVGGEKVDAVNEPKRVSCGAPDYRVTQQEAHGDLLIGHIEAKDIGTDLEAASGGEQLLRYRGALDNLILTNYLAFRWYVGGEERLVAQLATADNKGVLTSVEGGESHVRALLSDYLAHTRAEITSPRVLAERMARLTDMIRESVVESFQHNEATDRTKGLKRALKQVLLPNLTEPEFADIFSQTLAYGLFAASVNHDSSKGRFSRDDAKLEIPKTNPFLRKLFQEVTAADLEDEPYAGWVDDLAQLFADSDMENILEDFGKTTGRRDPIVHFYETFLEAYDPELRTKRGVYYTPGAVVNFIVGAVEEVLQDRFRCPDGLATRDQITVSRKGDDGSTTTAQIHRVLLLDPACGTGTFLYSVVDHIRKRFRPGKAGMWSGYVKDHLLPRLFGFELLMAPYAVAHLKLGMQLRGQDLAEADRVDWAYDFSGERLGVYLTNSLEQALRKSDVLLGQFISDEANAAAKVKEDPIMVVLGNPPYAGHSANKGVWVDHLLNDYYDVDGSPLQEWNTKWLRDDYVKFIRFGQWRIENTGDGILAYITNHRYLRNITFRGMREKLLKTFSDIYVIDLHGNLKAREVTPEGSRDENVFDIEQGVAIAVFIKQKGKSGLAKLHYTDVWGDRPTKLEWLEKHTLASVEWQSFVPAAPLYLFTPEDHDLRREYEPGWSVADIFPIKSLGILTKRDRLAIGFEKDELRSTLEEFVEPADSAAKTAEKFGLPLADKDRWDLSAAKVALQKGVDEDMMRLVQYRPLDNRVYYDHSKIVARRNTRVLSHLRYDNVALLAGRQGSAVGSSEWDVSWVAVTSTDQNLFRRGGATVFPLYVYNPDDDLFSPQNEVDHVPDRRANLNPAFAQAFGEALAMRFVQEGEGNVSNTFGPEDVLYYVYGILSASSYRVRYDEFLGRDFPRVPLMTDKELFRELRNLGRDLVNLHTGAVAPESPPNVTYPITGSDVVSSGYPKYKLEEESEGMGSVGEEATGRMWINETQYFGGIPGRVAKFHVGGYRVLEKWLKDRRQRPLLYDDQHAYERIIGIACATAHIVEKVDDAVEQRGGWPAVISIPEETGETRDG